jgi:hypothetical protein
MGDREGDLLEEAARLGLEHDSEGVLYYPGRVAVGCLGKPLKSLPFVRSTGNGYEVVKKGLLGISRFRVDSPRLAVFLLLHVWARSVRRRARSFITRVLDTAVRVAGKSGLSNGEACRDLYRGVGCWGDTRLLAATVSLYSIARYEAFRDPLEPSIKYLLGRRLIHRIGRESLAHLPSSLAIIARLLSGSWWDEDAYKRRSVKLASRVVSRARREYFLSRSGWLLSRSLAPGVDVEGILPLALALALAGHIRGPFLARLEGPEPLQALFSEVALFLDKEIRLEVGTPVEASSTVLSLDSYPSRVDVVYKARTRLAERKGFEEWVRARGCSGDIAKNRVLVVLGQRGIMDCLSSIFSMGYGAALSVDGRNAVVKPLEDTGEVLVYRVEAARGVKSLLSASNAREKPCTLEPLRIQRVLMPGRGWSLEGLLLKCDGVKRV